MQVVYAILTNYFLRMKLRKFKEEPLDGPYRIIVDTYNSVINMLSLLQWITLEVRRYTSRLSIFYKILYDYDFTIQIPPYFLKAQYSTRQHWPSHFILSPVNTTQYQQSYFPEQSKIETFYPP